ncbi:MULTISPECIES: ABC transporter substrate-binding protein [unclassified Microbacterium]|uniref:ABC transporter substrate-binding protein n=1 Tax=unclassified Microbacterium TaxID=2609290 RepID=UPI000EAABF9B|nr:MULTISPECIES: ABC transporter substrate-binding protein [unclassified Microbacterium]MBT2486525.1 ABC transporter substrate-binding protein [Microbacterium sp. ISL-108]RKN69218.1 ABC transporter substrate-binding protein [Microbacterium sp. CGR2]
MTLRMSYFVPPIPLVTAREEALFDAVDLVEIRTTGSPAQLEGLLTGDLDVVVTAIDNLFEWTRTGADVRLVGQVEATTPLSIHARPDITDLVGLAGRRFAVDAFSNGFALVARHALRTVAVDVEWVEVGGVSERLDALLSGDVAATLLGPPFDAKARAAGMSELLSIQEWFPTFPGQGLVVRSELIGDPELGRLLAAMREGGLLPVDAHGLDLLTGIRDDLGLLPAGPSLHALMHS